MLQSLWDYLRHAACDAVLAGVEDAVRILDQGRSTDGIVNASEHLGRRLAKAARSRVPYAQPAAAERTESSRADQRASDEPTKIATQLSGESNVETRPLPSLFESPAGHLQNGRQGKGQHQRGRKPIHKQGKA